jgi:hypothetical protein
VETELRACESELSHLTGPWYCCSEGGGRSGGAKTDVIYQDNDVCILRPDAVGGVVVFHFVAPDDVATVRLNGLPCKGGRKVRFRAPAFLENANMERAPSVLSINVNYPKGNGVEGNGYYACIRIDPKSTYIYSNPAVDRSESLGEKSRISLSEYVSTLKENLSDESENCVFNAITFKRVDSSTPLVWPFVDNPVNTYGVILVNCDVPEEWFVNSVDACFREIRYDYVTWEAILFVISNCRQSVYLYNLCDEKTRGTLQRSDLREVRSTDRVWMCKDGDRSVEVKLYVSHGESISEYHSQGKNKFTRTLHTINDLFSLVESVLKGLGDTGSSTSKLRLFLVNVLKQFEGK